MCVACNQQKMVDVTPAELLKLLTTCDVLGVDDMSWLLVFKVRCQGGEAPRCQGDEVARHQG